MKKAKQKTDYLLTEVNIDAISSQIDSYLIYLHMEQIERMRIRLSLEEALLRWRDNFDRETTVTVEVGSRFGTPQITFLLKGKRCNPLVSTEEDAGDWMQMLLTDMGRAPVYVYRQGFNVVQLKLSRPNQNPALSLLLSLALGTLFGLLGRALLPDTVRADILQTVLGPIQDMFHRILNLVAGLVIFFSVITAFCGVGSLSILNSSGRRLIRRFLLITLLIVSCGTVIGISALHLDPQFDLPDRENVAGGFEMLLQVVPNDPVSPLIECNSPQIIVMAMLVANVLLVLGPRVDGLKELMRQADAALLKVADWIGRVIPFFIATLLVLSIWNGSVRMLLEIWKPILLFVPLALLFCFAGILRVSVSKKVRVRDLVLKILPSFRKAFRTASVNASFDANLQCCSSKLGIHSSLTEYGLPLGLLTYMPAAALSSMLFVLSAAQVYHVSVTLTWLVTAVLLTTVLVVASPPVAGVGLLMYAALFTQLQIPQGAMIAAMVADILFGFLVSAVNQTQLQMELTLEADRLHMLDLQVLQREEPRLRKRQKDTAKGDAQVR
ncbi:MAG: cation:dicarboxylase symporter family transporter [Clostridia bacterium]|nr:cation:dicarboxylase symporter family transporter [Clostridia bacterium]